MVCRRPAAHEAKQIMGPWMCFKRTRLSLPPPTIKEKATTYAKMWKHKN
jgi:hypothetical protein